MNDSKKASATVTIKQIGSALRRDRRQGLYLRALGLGKMHRVRTLTDSPAVRGLIEKLKHMVEII